MKRTALPALGPLVFILALPFLGGCPGHLDEGTWGSISEPPYSDADSEEEEQPEQTEKPANPPPIAKEEEPAPAPLPPDAGSSVPQPSMEPAPPADAGAPDTTPAQKPTPVCATPNEVADKILKPKCGTCHGPNAAAAGLDLLSDGAKERVLDSPAKGCAGKTLAEVTAGDVTGHFFDKLLGAVAGCGGQMPFGAPPLSAEEIQCLKDWVAAPAGGTP